VLVTSFASVPHLRSAPPEKLYENLVDQVVLIETFDDLRRPLKQGSGVILGRSLCLTPPPVAMDPAYQKADTNGIDILSNYHVITFAHKILVQMKSGTQTLAAVVFGDSERDLAVLRTAESLGSRSAEFADAPKVGQRVYAIGAPKGFGWTLSDGLVSGLREHGGGQLIQTTAPISAGSSGGGLFDENGKLVGITTLQVEGGQNLNFARFLGTDDRIDIADARKQWSARPAGIDYDEWVVGVVKRLVGSDGSWRKSHPKWQLWKKLNLTAEQISRDERDELRERVAQKQGGAEKEDAFSFDATWEVMQARSVLRSYYLAIRYKAFQSDIEGLLGQIRLEDQAAERISSDKRIIPSAASKSLREISLRRRALIQSIPEEFNNRLDVVELHFHEALREQPTNAYEILANYLRGLPAQPKDDASDSIELSSWVRTYILAPNSSVQMGMRFMEQSSPRIDVSPLRSILREKGWSE
jgi:hypothetical protein